MANKWIKEMLQVICSLKRSDIRNLLLYDADAEDDDVDGEREKERAVCKTIRNQKEIPFKPKLNADFCILLFCLSKRVVAIEHVKCTTYMYLFVYTCVCVAISGRYSGSWIHFGRLRYHYLMQYKRKDTVFVVVREQYRPVVLMSCGILHLGTISWVQFLHFRSNSAWEAKYCNQWYITK